MIYAIVAVNNDMGIGNKGKLLFHIKEDMKRFKELTTGNTVIMGRKTLDSLPGGNPLKDRNNIVITSNEELLHSNPNLYVDSIEEALNKAKGYGTDIFIIGGESIYSQMIDYCDKIYLTEMNIGCKADAYFPVIDNAKFKLSAMSEMKQENNISFIFKTYNRVG